MIISKDRDSKKNLPRVQSLVMPSYVLLLVLAGILAGFLLVRSTPHGLGLVNDSAAYLGGAEGLLSGRGYSRLSGGSESRPITHFPPAFSLLLAGLGYLGLQLSQAAYGSIVVLYGLNAVLVGLSILVASRSKAFSLIGALLFAVNALFLRVHSLLMSEPLYLFLSLSGLLLFALYFRRRGYALLVGAGLLLGLASLTRYVGLAAVIAVMAVIVLLEDGWRRRAAALGLFTAAWLPPVLIWALRNRLATGFSSNRQLVIHPAEWEKYRVGIERIWAWLLPDRVLALFQNWPAVFVLALAVLAAGIAAVIAYGWLRRRRDADRSSTGFALWFVHGLYIFLYTAVLVGTITFLDASTSFELRILAPGLASLLVLIVSAWVWLWKLGSLPVRLGLALFVIVFSARFLSDGYLTVKNLQGDGQGYSRSVWQESETMQVIRDLPGEVIVYTNEPTGVYLLTGRGSFASLTPWDPVLRQPRPDYDKEMEVMKQSVREGKAVLFIFSPGRLVDPEDRQWYEDIRRDLQPSRYYADSEMYGWLP